MLAWVEAATAAAAIFAIALFLLALRRARRATLTHTLIVEIGDAVGPAGPRTITPLTLLLILAAAVGNALLLVRVLAIPALLGAPPLLLLAAAILLALFFRSLRESRGLQRARVVLVDVARSRRCDLYIPYLPPGDDEAQEELARVLRRCVADSRPSLVVLSIPFHAVWWTALGHALTVLAETSQTSLFAVCAWDPKVRDTLGQDAFIEALVNAGYAVVLVDWTRPSAVRALNALLGVREPSNLYQNAQGYLLVPCGEELLWDADARGAEFVAICEPETNEASWSLNLDKPTVRVRGPPLTLLAYRFETLHTGVACCGGGLLAQVVAGGGRGEHAAP
jgi:hypothetical protein